MVPIDMTAELGSLMIGMNVLMLIAGAAVAVSPWVNRIASFLSHGLSDTRLAVVGSSSSAAPTKREVAPSDASVPEAA